MRSYRKKIIKRLGFPVMKFSMKSFRQKLFKENSWKIAAFHVSYPRYLISKLNIIKFAYEYDSDRWVDRRVACCILEIFLEISVRSSHSVRLTENLSTKRLLLSLSTWLYQTEWKAECMGNMSLIIFVLSIDPENRRAFNAISMAITWRAPEIA